MTEVPVWFHVHWWFIPTAIRLQSSTVKSVLNDREEAMIRTIAIAVFGLAVASAVQAMPLAPIHQPESTITQVREGCGPAEY